MCKIELYNKFLTAFEQTTQITISFKKNIKLNRKERVFTENYRNNIFLIAIYRVAGTLVKGMMTSELEAKYKLVLKSALDAGCTVLENEGNSFDAEEKVGIILEDSHLFNAGKGVVFTVDETNKMEAYILDSKSLKVGEVSLTSRIKNSVSLSKHMMEESEHVFLAR